MSNDVQQIRDLETRFWQSMVDKDAKLASAMIADECLVTGPSGAMKLDPKKYEELTRDGQWTLDSFEFSDVDGAWRVGLGPPPMPSDPSTLYP